MRRLWFVTALLPAMVTTTVAASEQAFAGPTIAITASMSKPEITAGGSVSVSGVLTSNGVPVSDASVSLWGKAYGELGFSELTVGGLVTNQSGKVQTLHYPTKKTNYQWRYDHDQNTETPDVVSSTIVVKVRTKVSMRLVDSHISAGQKMVATGRTTPMRPGATVTVWRIRISGATEKWFKGTVKSDGTFRLAKRVPGTVIYRVYVVVAGGNGNLKGKSPTRDLYVGS